MPETMQALVVARAEPLRDPRRPRPGARPQRGPRARPRRVDLRHRRPPHPGRLPGLLAARVPVHPGPRVGGRDRGARAGRGALRLEGRRPGRRHVPRRLRRVPEVRRGPLQPVRELRQARAPPAVRPQRPGRRRDVRRPRRQGDLPAARRAHVRRRAPSSTRRRSRSTSPTGRASRPGDVVAITGGGAIGLLGRRRGADPRRRAGHRRRAQPDPAREGGRDGVRDGGCRARAIRSPRSAS